VRAGRYGRVARGLRNAENPSCVIVSPYEANSYLRTVIIAPMTSAERRYPTRVSIMFRNRRGQVALDQIRAVDKERLVCKLGAAPAKTMEAVSLVLVEMFRR
jgi:mRNA interferase MazF